MPKHSATRFAGGCKLDVEGFAALLGASVEEIPAECRKIIRERDFRYRVLGPQERDEVVLKILRTLESDLPVSGPERLHCWEEGWSESLRAFVASGYDKAALIPGYYRKGVQIMRLFGEYVRPESPTFETDVLAVLLAWVGCRFLQEAQNIFEFGCGPAHNLVALAELFPEKCYHGLDWAVSSQEIIRVIAEAHRIRITGRRVDMFEPDGSVRLEPPAAIMTVGAMEQLGERFRPFLAYLLQQRPVVCVHIEPIEELYDRNGLLDYLAGRYSEKRGYLRGFLTELRRLEKSNRLRIVHVHRNLGSLYHDGWSTVIWQPC